MFATNSPRGTFGGLLGRVAAGGHERAAGDVARADLQPDGHAALDPLPVLVAAAEVAVVDAHADRLAVVLLRGELGLERLAVRQHLRAFSSSLR